MDFNDHHPVFEDILYRTSVTEDLFVGSPLLRLSCSDRDGPQAAASLIYSVLHSESITSRDLFALDPTDGKLSLAKPLNR